MSTGRGARSPRAARTTALLAVAAFALTTGCTSRSGGSDDGRGETPRASADTRSPSASASDDGVAAGPVLAVKIDNVRAARPQTGLDAADVVYAEQVEGGLSRLMAVFAGDLPKVVGPVRSARESDLELLRQFDRPTLAFSGAQAKLLPLIGKAPLTAVRPDDDPGAFFRGTDKQSPHNLYLRPARLRSSAPDQGGLTTGFRFGPAPEGGRPRSSVTVRYPAASFAFRWSADKHRWLVSTDGTDTVTTDGKRVAPATVVVQHVTIRRSGFHDVLGNNTPYTETVGSGTAEVLRDGKAYDARWKRETPDSGTEFTNPDGTPMDFAKGQVWVVFTKAR
ncbi:DUF3048 domain-containing protein [Streptomyces sp. NPDC090306]|uniref:DUF3048 domain-containing protein n=1 Tax=unclassified Streptomyces TaxID=2593676 RepID=UPI0036E47E62